MSYKIIKILFLKGVKAQRYNNALDKNLLGVVKKPLPTYELSKLEKSRYLTYPSNLSH